VIDVRLQDRIRNVFEQCEHQTSMVEHGEGLARLFQDETPGLLHRHALNCLLFNRRDVSPPRQARIWAALDITIYSALLAAWRFKWAETKTRYVERPIEYETRVTGGKPRFQVLYDRRVQPDGTGSEPRTLCPKPATPDPNDSSVLSPGTPRHPAYPSGHSTYSAAASEILAYFFPKQRAELEKLADNIGLARLWAGVHWRQDHRGGQMLGRAVAKRVIDQLLRDPVRPLTGEPPNPCDTKSRPTFSQVQAQALETRGKDKGDPQQDIIPPPPAST
jgi:hypothetical protein